MIWIWTPTIRFGLIKINYFAVCRTLLYPIYRSLKISTTRHRIFSTICHIMRLLKKNCGSVDYTDVQLWKIRTVERAKINIRWPAPASTASPHSCIKEQRSSLAPLLLGTRVQFTMPRQGHRKFSVAREDGFTRSTSDNQSPTPTCTSVFFLFK
jgi:hypothetical protein